MRNPPAPRCGPVDQGDRPATGDLTEYGQDASRQGLPEARGATAHSGDPQSARAGADPIIRSVKTAKSSIRVMALAGPGGECAPSPLEDGDQNEIRADLRRAVRLRDHRDDDHRDRPVRPEELLQLRMVRLPRDARSADLHLRRGEALSR